MFFRKPLDRPLYDELRKWRDAGLIDFKESDDVLEVFASVLAQIRDHMISPDTDNQTEEFPEAYYPPKSEKA